MTVEARDIHFAYRPREPVLKGVTASARAGRITAVVGPNAAGKTTLLKVLLGLLEPDRGIALLHGDDVAAMPGTQRARRLAYVAQRPRVDAPFIVREVIELGRYRLGRSAPAVDFAIAACDLDSVADRPFHELSVGQQQRVALARALAQLHGVGEGAAMLLDEPTSAMDPRHVGQTVRLLRDAAARGIAVIVAMHDLPTAARAADDVWVMVDGRCVAAGPLRDTLTESTLRQAYGVAFTWVGPGDASIPVPMTNL